MKKILICSLLILQVLMGYSQNLPPFKTLRYDEDYGFLRSDSSNDWYHKTKFMPLSKNKETYVSFGGEIRYQYFYFKNEGWGAAPEDKDGYILNRYIGQADFHAGKTFRTFVQLQSSLANGKATSSPVDENQLDFHQLFFDLAFIDNKDNNLTARIGRQEFLYGSQRIISVRDGPNNRQSFDAARLLYSDKKFKADAFFSFYVNSQRNIFDDNLNSDNKFWGLYTVSNKVPVLHNIDFYYLGLYREVNTFDDGRKKETRHSIGTRIWNKNDQWQYDFEGLYQWGKFGSGDISAWTLSSNLAYTFTKARYKPQLAVKTEFISGDKDYNDNKLNTFNPLFPRGAYFGYAAIIGPANLIDIHPTISFALTRKFNLSFDYDAFWRYSSNDGIYGPNVALLYSGKSVSDKFIGNQYSTFFIYEPNNHLYFRGECTFFDAGPYLKSASPGKNIWFAGPTTQFKF